jgi:hypothetical protein
MDLCALKRSVLKTDDIEELRKRYLQLETEAELLRVCVQQSKASIRELSGKWKEATETCDTQLKVCYSTAT